jgi:hypothetical protein
MKKNKTKLKKESEKDLLPEYDFTGKKGTRGKYCRQYREGHTVKILKEDGTTDIKYFTLEDGAVTLEPDVLEYFSNMPIDLAHKDNVPSIFRGYTNDQEIQGAQPA